MIKFSILITFLFLNTCAPVFAKNGAKEIFCSFSNLEQIKVSYNKLTVLSFSERPIKVLSGENSFDLTFIKNDLALKALKPKRSTNLFVYLKNQTCAFRLDSVPDNGDEIILVKGIKK